MMFHNSSYLSPHDMSRTLYLWAKQGEGQVAPQYSSLYIDIPIAEEFFNFIENSKLFIEFEFLLLVRRYLHILIATNKDYI